MIADITLLSSSFPCQIRTVSGHYNRGRRSDCYRQPGYEGSQRTVVVFGRGVKESCVFRRSRTGINPVLYARKSCSR